ncbi:MAG: hypothetical protein V4525_12805 [Pseudomonadota bacterium]
MRVIMLGSELINLSTANYLAEAGYEITVIENLSEKNSKKNLLQFPVENHLFLNTIENNLAHAGVNFRYECKVVKFITEGKIIRAISIINEYNEPEILFADRFIAAVDYRNHSILKTLGIYSPSQFKPFNNEPFRNPLIGRSYYTNLYLSVGQSIIGMNAVSQSGKFLADFIYNPSEIKFPPQESFLERTLSNIIPFYSSLSASIQRFFGNAI